MTASDGQVYAISVWAEKESDDCAAHAYGQVADFLTAHQCTGIRQLLATTAINGTAVGFAQNSVGFAGGMRQVLPGRRPTSANSSRATARAISTT